MALVIICETRKMTRKIKELTRTRHTLINLLKYCCCNLVEVFWAEFRVQNCAFRDIKILASENFQHDDTNLENGALHSTYSNRRR